MNNIGPTQRRYRLYGGLTAILAGIILATLLLSLDINALWRLTVFFPFWLGLLGFCQNREGV